MKADVAVAPGATLGESPLWSSSESKLYWVDIEGKAVHRFDPKTGVDSAQILDRRPGSIALTGESGTLLVAAEHEVGSYDFEANRFEPWMALEPAGTGNRLNDGRTDRSGRFLVGSMWADPGERQYTGWLHRVDGPDRFATLWGDVGVSNGLAFSPDGSTMYWADTMHDTVWAYDYREGEPSGRRVFLDFSSLPGRPDGACVDADGCYWVACIYGWAVLRATPDGDVDRIVELPLEKPTMPAFGGDDLATLFVTSISGGGGSVASMGSRELDGAVLALDVGVSGLSDAPFRG